MKPSELIGMRIKDVKNKLELFSEGELESSDALIELETGEIFTIPHFNSKSLTMVKSTSFKHTSIFNEDGLLKKILNRTSYNKRIAKRNKEKIKGAEIVRLYQLEQADEDSDPSEVEGRLIIEVESGYLISEKGASIFALGDAGIQIYQNKEEIENQYEQKLKIITTNE